MAGNFYAQKENKKGTEQQLNYNFILYFFCFKKNEK